MSYAERITNSDLSSGSFGKLLTWTLQAVKRSPAKNSPAADDLPTALDRVTAIDVAVTRESAEYKTANATSQGSQARLHKIAESIAAALPR